MCNFERSTFTINNEKIRNQIEKEYNRFKETGLTLSDFYQTTIAIAKQNTNTKSKLFSLERFKITFPRIVIIFGDRHGYFMDCDLNQLKSRDPIKIEINSLTMLLGLPPFDLINEYHGRLNIYKIKQIKNSNGKELLVGVRHHGVPGLTPKAVVNVAVDQWPPTELFWLPSDNLIQNKFFCKTTKCGFSSDRMDHLRTHEAKCSGIQEIIPKQTLYGLQDDCHTKLKKIFNMVIPNQKHMAVYDIETFNNGKHLIVVSIAVASTLDCPKYFQRKNDDPESGYLIVKQFMKYLLFLQKKLVFKQTWVMEEVSYLEQENESSNLVSSNVMRQLINFIKSYNTLKCFGFNAR